MPAPASAVSPAKVGSRVAENRAQNGNDLGTSQGALKQQSESRVRCCGSGTVTARITSPFIQEAVLRTQSLFHAGSREAAMGWLQEAIAVAERSPVASNRTAGNLLLCPLVREQARMLLADRRCSALWELLSRLEPQQGTAPELWIIRANTCAAYGSPPGQRAGLPDARHATRGAWWKRRRT